MELLDQQRAAIFICLYREISGPQLPEVQPNAFWHTLGNTGSKHFCLAVLGPAMLEVCALSPTVREVNMHNLSLVQVSNK